MSAVFAVLCALLAPVTADPRAVNCSQVKDAFSDLGYSPARVPTEETAGIDSTTTLSSANTPLNTGDRGKLSHGLYVSFVKSQSCALVECASLIRLVQKQNNCLVTSARGRTALQ